MGHLSPVQDPAVDAGKYAGPARLMPLTLLIAMLFAVLSSPTQRMLTLVHCTTPKAASTDVIAAFTADMLSPSESQVQQSMLIFMGPFS